MRLSGRSIERAAKCELSMTSMIDVVFLLLIFFLTTSSFVKTERELDPAIRVQKPSAQQNLSDLEPAIVKIVRGEAGYVYQIGGLEITSVEQLTSILRQFEDKSGGAFVQVSDGAPFQMAATAIHACKAARFRAVSYVPIESSE